MRKLGLWLVVFGFLLVVAGAIVMVEHLLPAGQGRWIFVVGASLLLGIAAIAGLRPLPLGLLAAAGAIWWVIESATVRLAGL